MTPAPAPAPPPPPPTADGCRVAAIEARVLGEHVHLAAARAREKVFKMVLYSLIAVI